MIDVKYKMDGNAGLEAALAKLPLLTQRTTLKRAANEAAKPIEKEARKIAVDEGFSKERAKSIKRKARTPRKNTNYRAIVEIGPVRGAGKKTGKSGFVLSIWELGFKHRGGKIMPARPQVVPAIEAKKAESVASFGAIMEKHILRAVENLKKKKAKK